MLKHRGRIFCEVVNVHVCEDRLSTIQCNTSITIPSLRTIIIRSIDFSFSSFLRSPWTSYYTLFI